MKNFLLGNGLELTNNQIAELFSLFDFSRAGKVNIKDMHAIFWDGKSDEELNEETVEAEREREYQDPQLPQIKQQIIHQLDQPMDAEYMKKQTINEEYALPEGRDDFSFMRNYENDREPYVQRYEKNGKIYENERKVDSRVENRRSNYTYKETIMSNGGKVFERVYEPQPRKIKIDTIRETSKRYNKNTSTKRRERIPGTHYLLSNDGRINNFKNKNKSVDSYRIKVHRKPKLEIDAEKIITSYRKYEPKEIKEVEYEQSPTPIQTPPTPRPTPTLTPSATANNWCCHHHHHHILLDDDYEAPSNPNLFTYQEKPMSKNISIKDKYNFYTNYSRKNLDNITPATDANCDKYKYSSFYNYYRMPEKKYELKFPYQCDYCTDDIYQRTQSMMYRTPRISPSFSTELYTNLFNKSSMDANKSVYNSSYNFFKAKSPCKQNNTFMNYRIYNCYRPRLHTHFFNLGC